MNSQINEVQATVEEIKSAPKVVIAFRATCATNFPSGRTTHKDENPGDIIFFYFENQFVVFIYFTSQM